MKNLELFNFVKDISLFFERKMPNNETLDQWLPEVEFIPGEPIPWIAKNIKTLDAFPRNLPKAMKHYWFDWLNANPSKRAAEQEYGCEGCVSGFIQVSRFETELGRFYNCTFRCDACRPRYPAKMAMSNTGVLAERGYYRPLGYLTSLKYAESMPVPVERGPVTPVQRGPIDGIVGQVADGMYPF